MTDLNRLADLLLPGIRNAQLKLEEVSNYLGVMPYSLRHYDGWQPIETAPKDGTPILIYSGLRVDVPRGHVDHEKSIYISSFDGDWWIWDGNFGAEYAYEPTHWMNLPESPK